MPEIKKMRIQNVDYDIKDTNPRLMYLTTAPTEDNLTNELKVVVLPEPPETKYEGYLYIITE